MLREIHKPPFAKGEIYWFCHAGAGPASLVRSSRGLKCDHTIRVGTLPGREDRYRDGLSLSLDEIVDQFTEELDRTIEGPFALVGHSFGSLLSYLIAQKLVDRGKVAQHLTVMTLASPDRIERIPSAADKSDSDFLDYLDQRFGNVPDALRQNQEALNLFLPIVKYDMRLLESYEYNPQPPLPIPMLALGGTNDNAVSRSDLSGWKAFTSEDFSLRILNGDHFFPVTQMKQVVDLSIRGMQL